MDSAMNTKYDLRGLRRIRRNVETSICWTDRFSFFLFFFFSFFSQEFCLYFYILTSRLMQPTPQFFQSCERRGG